MKITATDSGGNTDTIAVTIAVLDIEDSIGTIKVEKANPVPGIYLGDPMSALSDAKTTKVSTVPERPEDLPATERRAPHNFVEASWANWGTTIRIEVTAESPDSSCGNGNQCVFVDAEADSSDDKLRLIAYRSDGQENRFIAAVQFVQDGGTSTTLPVYKDADGGVAQLETDEEDEILIRLANSRVSPITIDVENEAPEFDRFTPEHGAAVNNTDVVYTFTITDAISGIPEPEDLPDPDGDSNYMPLVAIVSSGQCHTADPASSDYTMYDFAGNSLWCRSMPEIRHVTDDRDFDELNNGFEVRTTIVLPENETSYVSFIVCDNAGNCTLYAQDRPRPTPTPTPVTPQVPQEVLNKISALETLVATLQGLIATLQSTITALDGRVTALESNASVPTPISTATPVAAPCVTPITGDGVITASWIGTCQSTNRPLDPDKPDNGTYYARYYTFDITTPSSVTISLGSSEDTFLYLLHGKGKAGSVAYFNDDIEYPDNSNSRIEQTLQAGSYTIEAATYKSGVVGSSFTLTLSGTQ